MLKHSLTVSFFLVFISQLSAYCLEEHGHKTGIWQILVESDLLNVIILFLAIIYLGNKFLPKIIDQRKNQITKELNDAQITKQKAEKELEEIREKTKNILNEIKEIKEEARNSADIIKKQIETDTGKELENLKLKVNNEIRTIHDETVEEIRKVASTIVLKLAEETVSRFSKNKEVQDKLTKDFLKGLKEASKN